MAYRQLVSHDPATEKQVYVTPQLSDAQLRTKIHLAAKAQQRWRDTHLEARARLLKKAAILLREKKMDLAQVAAVEMGKTLKAGVAEIEKCATTLEYYAEHAASMLGPEIVNTEAKKSYVRFDPLGVVLAVMPWNFPFWQVFRAAAPALMAGNTMLLKHASNVQRCALETEKIFTKAGFPKGIFTNLAIESSRVENVIRDERVAAVTLTGSEQAGSQVARVAGEVLKKTVLELGGSDPFIVLSDADLEAACETAVLARLQANVGQSCISAKRFIVDKSVHASFVKGVAERLSKLVVGDPRDSATNVGPLASKQMLETIEKQVHESIKRGAKAVFGGSRKTGRGYFFIPTLLTGVKKGMPAYDEELFGPVIAVIQVSDEKKALQVANDTIYGLGSTIFTKNIEKAEKMAESIHAGAVFINSAVKSDPRLPFGGVKKSGYGRELAHYGIREFVNIKTVYSK
ncbi:MAG: hypothetical protein RIQ56_224 [Candidatus Parcubacteria bacterium]|jgi:succinate-semialdehyde dehydrogenase/glutarate-semialdehyde dehydrogenase